MRCRSSACARSCAWLRSPGCRAHRSSVLGVISLRGEIVQVLDLRRALGAAALPPTRRSRIVVLHSEAGEIAGWLVDAVSEVLRVPESELRPPPGDAGELVVAICVRGRRFVSLLEPRTEMQSLVTPGRATKRRERRAARARLLRARRRVLRGRRGAGARDLALPAVGPAAPCAAPDRRGRRSGAAASCRFWTSGACSAMRRFPLPSARVCPFCEFDGCASVCAYRPPSTCSRCRSLVVEALPALAVQAGYEVVRAVVRRPGASPLLVLSLEALLERVFRSAAQPGGGRVTERALPSVASFRVRHTLANGLPGVLDRPLVAGYLARAAPARSGFAAVPSASRRSPRSAS